MKQDEREQIMKWTINQSIWIIEPQSFAKFKRKKKKKVIL